MTNLEKIANVLDELGCNIYYAKDGSYIDVHYEMITNRTDHVFTAEFDTDVWNDADVDLNDINWKEELEIRFSFEDELGTIEEDFCRYHIGKLFDPRECISFGSGDLQNIVDNWKKEKEQIEIEFEEFCTNFERLIKKYTNSEVLEKFQKAVDNCEYGDGIIERDGDKYYLVVDYSVDNEEGDIIRATTEIIEGKYVENILDELEGDFCKYDLDSLEESEANALRHAFFDNYLPALKKELGVK